MGQNRARSKEPGLNKKNLSESDICERFVRPALEQAGWDGMAQIYREYPLRVGRMVVRGSLARRDQRTVVRADYALFFKANIPLAAGGGFRRRCAMY